MLVVNFKYTFHTVCFVFSGMWLCGLMVTGELFLWNRDKDLLKTAAAVLEVVEMIKDAQGRCCTCVKKKYIFILLLDVKHALKCPLWRQNVEVKQMLRYLLDCSTTLICPFGCLKRDKLASWELKHALYLPFLSFTPVFRNVCACHWL